LITRAGLGGSALPIGGYAPRATSHGEGLDLFRRLVLLGTGGEVEMPVTWNILDADRPVLDLLDLVEAGEMFMCYFSTSYLGHRVRQLNVLEIPYLFSDLDAAHRRLDGRLGEVLTDAVRSSTGFDVLGYWDNGFRQLSNRLRTVRSPRDCAGMKIRLQPNPYHEEMVRGWGAIPVAAELQVGIGLIRSGQVDAQENPLANSVAYGVDQVHGHFTMTGHLYGARGLFVHRPTWDGLPRDIKGVIGAAAEAAIAHQRGLAAGIEKKLRASLEAAGIEFVDLTPAERAAFVEASAPAADRARHELGVELYELARGERS
jgi:TRAP-type C4-dicarboxylate transport system substrate-binding protein